MPENGTYFLRSTPGDMYFFREGVSASGAGSGGPAQPDVGLKATGLSSGQFLSAQHPAQTTNTTTPHPTPLAIGVECMRGKNKGWDYETFTDYSRGL